MCRENKTLDEIGMELDLSVGLCSLGKEIRLGQTKV